MNFRFKVNRNGAYHRRNKPTVVVYKDTELLGTIQDGFFVSVVGEFKCPAEWVDPVMLTQHGVITGRKPLMCQPDNADRPLTVNLMEPEIYELGQRVKVTWGWSDTTPDNCYCEIEPIIESPVPNGWGSVGTRPGNPIQPVPDHLHPGPWCWVCKQRQDKALQDWSRKPGNDPQPIPMGITAVLHHSDEVSGTTVFHDGTRMYWTEGRGSCMVVVKPDAIVYEFRHGEDDGEPIVQMEQALEAYGADINRAMTAEEEAEWERQYRK